MEKAREQSHYLPSFKLVCYSPQPVIEKTWEKKEEKKTGETKYERRWKAKRILQLKL